MEIKLKSRKLQEINGTFFVTLPIEWIRSTGAKKGDLIHVAVKENGDLIIRRGK